MTWCLRGSSLGKRWWERRRGPMERCGNERPRAPSLKRASDPKWGKPIQLFNGRDLSGWKMSDPNATPPWKVENGTLVSPWTRSGADQ